MLSQENGKRSKEANAKRLSIIKLRKEMQYVVKVTFLFDYFELVSVKVQSVVSIPFDFGANFNELLEQQN